ncbi:MAG: hypothetical protein NTV94_03575 [Planctomycetota bacterium]|nr:hypothetical protein [Planctomycetota bacterium]
MFPGLTAEQVAQARASLAHFAAAVASDERAMAISSLDPRFGSLVNALDPGATTAAQAVASAPTQPFSFKLLMHCRELTAEIERTQGLNLCQEFEELLAAIHEERGVKMSRKRLVFPDACQPILSDIGEEFGVTKAAVGASLTRLDDVIAESNPWLPRARELLDRLTRCEPTESAQRPLIRMVWGDRAPVPGPDSILAILQVLLPHEASQWQLGVGPRGRVLQSPARQSLQDSIDEMESKMRAVITKRVARWGVCSRADAAAALIDEGYPVGAQCLAQLLDRRHFIWGGEYGDWIVGASGGVAYNSLTNECAKMLSVCASATAEELLAGFMRLSGRRECDLPAAAVVAACKANSMVRIEGCRISIPGSTWQSELGEIEFAFVTELMRTGVPGTRQELIEAVLANGSKENSASCYLSWSSVLVAIERGVFGLIGRDYSSESIAAARARFLKKGN